MDSPDGERQNGRRIEGSMMIGRLRLGSGEGVDFSNGKGNTPPLGDPKVVARAIDGIHLLIQLVCI